MNTSILRSLIASLFLSCLFASTATAAERPNIIYIMADDMGIGDVNCYGGDTCQIDTPHMDSLARDGMKFTDAHPVASVCVPSRIAIMTGRYPWRFRSKYPNAPWGFITPRVPTDHNTLGRMLRSAGYRTGYVGKWHLGTWMQTTDGKTQGLKNVDYKKPLKIGPVQYGFDYSFILPGSLDMYPYVFVRNNEFVGNVNALKGWSAFNRIGPAEENFEDFKVLNQFSTEAEQYIARNAVAAQNDKPFFLYFALTAPHTPTSPSPKFQGKSKLGLYGDFVAETDDCVGRVLKALKKHKLDKNTLVIVTSDHGPGVYAGNVKKATINNLRQLEKLGHDSNWIYRDYKFSAYEGGLRVPFLVRWPGVVKPGSVSDGLVGLNDLMATVAEVSGAKVKPLEAPDSISFLPLLRNAKSESPRRDMILQSTHAFVVRQNNWKLALCPGCGGGDFWGNEPKREPSWKKAIQAFGKQPTRNDLNKPEFVQLFNLANDPGENHNLAGRHPEMITRLYEILEDQINSGRSTPGPDLELTSLVNVFAGVPRFVLKGKRSAARTTSKSISTKWGKIHFRPTGLELAIADLPANRAVSIPRLNNPIGLVYLKGDTKKTPLKFKPEREEWIITLPKSGVDSGADSKTTVIVETKGAPKIAKVLPVISKSADGSLILHAHNGLAHGKMLRYEPQPHKNTIGYWVNEKDWCEWQFQVSEPGKYNVHIFQGCGKGQGGSEVDVIVNGKPNIRFTVEDTGHFQNFKDRNIGSVEFYEPGKYTLQIRPVKKAVNAVMDVRRVRLIPVR